MALANGLGGHLLQGLAPSLLRSSFSTVQVVQHNTNTITANGGCLWFDCLSKGDKKNLKLKNAIAHLPPLWKCPFVPNPFLCQLPTQICNNTKSFVWVQLLRIGMEWDEFKIQSRNWTRFKMHSSVVLMHKTQPYLPWPIWVYLRPGRGGHIYLGFGLV